MVDARVLGLLAPDTLVSRQRPRRPFLRFCCWALHLAPGDRRLYAIPMLLGGAGHLSHRLAPPARGRSSSVRSSGDLFFVEPRSPTCLAAAAAFALAGVMNMSAPLVTSLARQRPGGGRDALAAYRMLLQSLAWA
jgi:hypothetical protein